MQVCLITYFDYIDIILCKERSYEVSKIPAGAPCVRLCGIRHTVY